MASERAALFIDGSNFFHTARSVGVRTGALDYQALARKLMQSRRNAGTRYYIGRVTGDLPRTRAQGRFLKRIREQGVHVVLGRVERRLQHPAGNPWVLALRQLLEVHRRELREPMLAALEALCRRPMPQYVEKKVDVAMAVDLATMAYRDRYDVAYLLSADGDFVPAVEAVRSLGKKVFAASPGPARELALAVDTFIPLRRRWFDDLVTGESGHYGSGRTPNA